MSLPEGMKRSMPRQAEAERERRARIIVADGEYQASKRLAAAANVMARDPAALQLRLLQTVVEVAVGEEQHAGDADPGRAAALLRPGIGPSSSFAGDLPVDTGEAEVAAAEAAIEHRAPAAPEAIESDETLAIPPVAAIPERRRRKLPSRRSRRPPADAGRGCLPPGQCDHATFPVLSTGKVACSWEGVREQPAALR